MARIRRRPLCVEDLNAVWRFVAADNEAAAERLLRELEERT